jgi:hypothetical protein
MVVSRMSALCLQVTSYGGYLRYTLEYTPGYDSSPDDYPDVELSVSIASMYGCLC